MTVSPTLRRVAFGIYYGALAAVVAVFSVVLTEPQELHTVGPLDADRSATMLELTYDGVESSGDVYGVSVASVSNGAPYLSFAARGGTDPEADVEASASQGWEAARRAVSPDATAQPRAEAFNWLKGTSGGLAYALVAANHLCGGELVAEPMSPVVATGEVDDGYVHPVGETSIKVEAAASFGATAVFVPAGSDVEHSDVEVIEVAEVSDAIAVLIERGGSCTPR